MQDYELTLLIHQIDEFLAEISHNTIIEARKPRDQLMDLRLMCMAMEEKKDSPVLQGC